MKTKLVLLCCMSSLIMGACKKDEARIDAYLEQWMGYYEGTSHHWMTHPGDMGWINYSSDRNVLVLVHRSELDSCLNLTITYNDTIINHQNELYFPPDGKHFSQWGGGSSYGSLNIQFEDGMMDYHYFQKCGIPCSSGIEFNIGKKGD